MGSFTPLAILATFFVATTFVLAAPVTLRFNQVSGGVDLEMLNTVPVAGFQGKLTRVPKNVVPVPVEGPLSQSAGFIFDFNNQTEIFLGVSLTGTDIASQSAYGQLCQFNVKTKGKYCVGELIFSDPFGQALTFEFEKEGGDCVTIDNPTH